MSVELTLGIIGTITGIIGTIVSLFLFIWKIIREKPVIKISDTLLSLEKIDENKVKGGLSFNLDNIGDRSTTVTRVAVILGDYVEVIEGLRSISPHSSIRYPEKMDSTIYLVTLLKEIENLKITVVHTHGTFGKTIELPQVSLLRTDPSEWDKQALYKGGPIDLTP